MEKLAAKLRTFRTNKKCACRREPSCPIEAARNASALRAINDCEAPVSSVRGFLCRRKG